MWGVIVLGLRPGAADPKKSKELEDCVCGDLGKGTLFDGLGGYLGGRRGSWRGHAAQDAHLDPQMPPRRSTWTPKRGHGVHLGGQTRPRSATWKPKCTHRSPLRATMDSRW